MSIRWRILGALVLAIALTASLSLGVGYYVAQRQFDAFVSQLGRREAQNLAGRLSRAYTEAAGWETLDIALDGAGYLYEKEAEHGEGDDGKHDGDESELFHIDRIRIVIVDVAGVIIRDNFLELAIGQFAPDLSGEQIEVLDLRNGLIVGFAYVDVHQDFLATESLGFLRELFISSAFGVLCIIVSAVLLATSLSKRITAPIAALTRATQTIARADDATLLPIASSDELGQMSMAFNKMVNALQRQRDLRRRLVNDVSHELNTPLTIIQLEAKGLLDNLQTPKQAAQHIIQEVSMLRNLVSDLSYLAATEPGELEPQVEPCALDKLLSSEVERWQPQALAQSISLSLHPLPQLPALQLDSARMRQALGNIIHNALQHAEQGQVIVAATMENEGYVQISVSDDGAGIAAKDIPHVFHRFYRAEQPGGRGAGLGLDIARAIIEAHGGTISLHSDGIGRGTTVEFRLPVSADKSLSNQKG